MPACSGTGCRLRCSRSTDAPLGPATTRPATSTSRRSRWTEGRDHLVVLVPDAGVSLVAPPAHPDTGAALIAAIGSIAHAVIVDPSRCPRTRNALTDPFNSRGQCPQPPVLGALRRLSEWWLVVADRVPLELGVGVGELVGQAGVVVAVAGVQVAAEACCWPPPASPGSCPTSHPGGSSAWACWPCWPALSPCSPASTRPPGPRS